MPYWTNWLNPELISDSSPENRWLLGKLYGLLQEDMILNYAWPKGSWGTDGFNKHFGITVQNYMKIQDELTWQYPEEEVRMKKLGDEVDRRRLIAERLQWRPLGVTLCRNWGHSNCYSGELCHFFHIGEPSAGNAKWKKYVDEYETTASGGERDALQDAQDWGKRQQEGGTARTEDLVQLNWPVPPEAPRDTRAKGKGGKNTQQKGTAKQREWREEAEQYHGFEQGWMGAWYNSGRQWGVKRPPRGPQ